MISLRHARQHATRVLAFAVALAASGSMVNAAPIDVVAVKAKALHVGDGSIIKNGVIVIRDGRIAEIGANVRVPAGATLIEIESGSVTPGLIDADAALEPTNVMTPRRRAARQVLHDYFDPTHSKHAHAGCCGSTCSRAERHVEGGRCEECGYPFEDDDDALAVGTARGRGSGEGSSEVIPNTNVIDSINLRSPDFERLVAGGVTTVFAAADSSAVIGSRAAIVRTAGPLADRVVRDADALQLALGTDPSWRGGGNRRPFRRFVDFRTRRPTTRMGVTWVFRKALYDTQRHRAGEPVGGADAPSAAAMTVLDGLLDGTVPLRVHARTLHDITSALRLTSEFNLRFTLAEATEAYRCLDELSAAGVPVVFGPIYISAPGARASTAEVGGARLHSFRALLDAGIETALSAHDLRDEDGLARQAMYAMRYGVSLAQVTSAVTQTPAKLLGLDKEIGTLERGKRADLVVWSGGPFDASSAPVVVLIDGRIVFDRRTG